MNEGAKQAKPLRLIPSNELAAYLIISGFPLLGCRPNARGIGFLFEDSASVENAMLRFANGQTQVEPRSFLRALNDLRDLARSYSG